ncbi:MAG: D-3-phosphoglycerate dehydrogenase [Acidimicrobiaceae bacterium]|nr:D-3-phosphoglycerate dehydrogenase [Acidimicrobiaceae bacterium]
MLALVSAKLTGETAAAVEDERGWQLRQVASVASEIAAMSAAERAQVGAVFIEAEPVAQDMLAQLDNLEVVACLRSEPVNVDLEAANALGVAVLHTPGRNAEAVADFSLGLCLAALRNIAIAHHAIVSNELTSATAAKGVNRASGDVIWRPDDPEMPIPYVTYKGHQLSRLTVVVVGFGAVGRATARRFAGLVAEVGVVDPMVPPEEISARGFSPFSLEEALERADVITLHARSASVIIGRAELARMKPGSYLINTARATVLDHDALVDALESGHLGGAALDVFPDEPIPRSSRLLGVPRLTLTPHLAGAAFEVADVQSEIILSGVRGIYDAELDWSELPVRNPEVRKHWEARFMRV